MNEINLINFFNNIFKENNSQKNNNNNNEINIEQNQLLVSSLFLLSPNLNKTKILQEILNYLNNNNINEQDNNFNIFLLSIVYSIIKYKNSNNNDNSNNNNNFEIVFNIIKIYINQIINENKLQQQQQEQQEQQEQEQVQQKKINNIIDENKIKILSRLISKIQNLIFNKEIYSIIISLIDGVNQVNSSGNNKFGLLLVNGILNDNDSNQKDKEIMSNEFYPILIPMVIENLKNSNLINQYTKQQSLFILSKLLLDKESVDLIQHNEKLINLYFQNCEWLKLLWESIIRQKDSNERLKLCFFFHQCYFDCLIYNLKSKKFNSNKELFNVIKRSEYWSILFEALIDKDSLPRKQAIHLLKNTVSLPPIIWKESLPKQWEQKQWNLFFSLYESFDETKSHLFIPVWVQIHNLIVNNSDQDNFTRFKDQSSIYFWIRILYFRGFNHINVNIKKRVILDALSDQLILKHINEIEFSEFQMPLLKSLDTYEITFNFDPTPYQSNNSERTKELVDKLTNYFNITIQSNKQFEMVLQFISKSIQEIKTILLFLSILSKLSSTQLKLSSSSGIMESIRYLLISHPYTQSSSNVQLYNLCFQLLKSLNISKDDTLSFSQLSKILSILPNDLINDDKEFKLNWLNSKGDWFFNNLIKLTNEIIINQHIDNDQSSTTTTSTSSTNTFENDKENLLNCSKLLLILSDQEIYQYIDETILKLINDNEKFNKYQQIKLLILLNYILEELPEKYWIKISNQIDSIKFTLIKLINQYILEKNDMVTGTLTKEESEKIIDQFKMFEIIIKLIKKLSKSKEFQDLSNHMNQYIMNDGNGNQLDLKGITIVLLTWIQCKQQLLHQVKQQIENNNLNQQEELFNKLLKLEPKYKFDSTISYILPKFIQFKWTCIHSILFNNNSKSIMNYDKELLFELGLSALDNSTGSALIPIFECLSIVLSSSDESKGNTTILNNERLMDQLFKQSYLAFSDSNKKPNNLCIAFSNLLFNSVLFENEITIPLVKQYLKQTLEDWGGSVRISCGLLSHCCSIWSKKINTLPIFLNEIIDLCLLTSEDKLIFDDNQSQLQSDEASTTSTSSSSSFKLFNNHGYIIRWFVSQLSNEQCKPFVKTLILELLKLNFNKEFSKREYSQQSRTNKMKCKLWRTLCSLTHIINFNDDDDDSIEFYQEISELMWKTLELKNHGNVRYLIQLFIINILIKSPNLNETNSKLIQRMESSINADYQITASLIIISSTLLYYLLNNFKEQYKQMVIDLFKTLLPWSTDFHHAVRTTTQLAIYTIINKKFKILEEFNENQFIQSIYNYLDTHKIQKRLREKQTLFIGSDDPLKKTLPENIFTSTDNNNLDDNNNSTANDDDDENGNDSGNNKSATSTNKQDDDDYSNLSIIDDSVIPMSLLDISKKLIKDFQISFQNNQIQHSASIQSQPQLQSLEESIENIQIDNNNDNNNDNEEDQILDFQRRITPWQWVNKLEEHHQINNNNNSTTTNTNSNNTNSNNVKKNKRQSMIVVGTFIENTPNLAGLIRTCEIFNVEEVAIPNLKLLNDPQFQRVSVSAEKLLPIIEITKPNLLDYLKLKKKEGYSILGVEQTSQSKNLTDFKFPDKCLLLLGQEQNGIPANYLTIVDYCVEIPQLGQIRSLNVHVSASIVVWEFTQQQLINKQQKQITNNGQ